MLFQTPEFFVLLVLVLVGLPLCDRSRTRQQWLLLAASYVFYGWWDVRFLVLLMLSSVVDYGAALGVTGIKLPWPTRWRISAMLIGAAAVFLGLNWPAIQGPEKLSSLTFAWSRDHVLANWPGAGPAIIVCVTFAVVGPFAYEWYFRLSDHRRRLAFLWTSIIANLGVLGFFKYFNFFADNLRGLGWLLGYGWAPSALDIALPVGISFYTFQTMSYTIDVYRGNVAAQRSLRHIALYVAYFPQLVAGPILRPSQFLPALDRIWTLDGNRLISGFHLVLVGLFKKVLIADSVARLVDTILSAPQGRPSLLIQLGVVLFAVQIYCDFSGYTDIARGVSRMFGVDIPLNFNFPYFSTSVTEFWRRWHISLSTWLRDYLYIPLGGNRRGSVRLYSNLLITMVLGGLWHGAAWNFVIWGAYQGILLCANRPLQAGIRKSSRLSRMVAHPLGAFLRWAITMYLVLLGWLIFRVSGTDDLGYAIKHFLVFDGRWELTGLGAGTAAPFTAVLAFAVFVVLHMIGYFGKPWPQRLDALPRPTQSLIYFLLGLVFFFAWPSQEAPFIYFQF